MKRNFILTATAFILLATLFAFGQKPSKPAVSVLDKMDVVARRTNVNKSTLVTCDLTRLKDTVNLPLSELVENIKLVKLEGKDEALVSGGNVTVSDNYFLIRNNKQNPYKLFSKNGKFITNIGSYGQGPNEYLNVYDDILDEKNKRIYILPWQSDKVLVYDLSGKALKPIPLPSRVPKGKIYVDGAKSVLSVAQLPFGNDAQVVWSQKFDGKVLNSIKGKHLCIKPDFSNEIFSDKSAGGFDFNIFTFFELRPDSLYHYDYVNNRLLPRFTLDFKNKTRKIHSYNELPRHFLGNVTVELKLSDNTSTTEYPAMFIVDKNTLKGAFYKCYNNYIGNIPVTWLSGSNGYYVRNVDPGQLMHEISVQLKSKKITDKQRQGLTKLLNSIDENDNNYIIYGKLKK